jgi:hypothetical protein
VARWRDKSDIIIVDQDSTVALDGGVLIGVSSKFERERPLTTGRTSSVSATRQRTTTHPLQRTVGRSVSGACRDSLSSSVSCFRSSVLNAQLRQAAQQGASTQPLPLNVATLSRPPVNLLPRRQRATSEGGIGSNLPTRSSTTSGRTWSCHTAA